METEGFVVLRDLTFPHSLERASLRTIMQVHEGKSTSGTSTQESPEVEKFLSDVSTVKDP